MNLPVEHFDEITALLYADGELDSSRRATVSAHSAECAACRRLLGTLTRESQLLGQALFEDTDPLPARLMTSTRKTAGHAAPWAWALCFGMTGLAVYFVWIAVLGPALDQLDGIGLGSANLITSVFFTGAFWEGWEPMLEILQYAMLLLFGLGVLFLLRWHWRRWPSASVILVGLALLFGAPRSASAADIRRGPSIIVAQGETVHNDLISAGNSLRVDGTVDGDVIAFGQNVNVDGHISGDVIAFSRNVRIVGTVDGNVRCFCGSLVLEGSVAKNVSIFAGDAELESKSNVGGGVIAFTGNITVDGKITRDLLLFARSTAIDGTVGGNVRLRGGKLTIGPSGEIRGTLHVISDARPEIASGAKLSQPLEFDYRPARAGNRGGRVVVGSILRYAAAFLCGLLLITALPGFFGSGMRAARQVGLSMGVGAIVLICGCALAIFSMVLLLTGVGGGVATVLLFAPIVYTAQLFVGAWIGEKLLGPATAVRSILGRLALGLLVLDLAEIIPILGWLILLAAAIWGTGAVCMALWNRLSGDVPVAGTSQLNV